MTDARLTATACPEQDPHEARMHKPLQLQAQALRLELLVPPLHEHHNGHEDDAGDEAVDDQRPLHAERFEREARCVGEDETAESRSSVRDSLAVRYSISSFKDL